MKRLIYLLSFLSSIIYYSCSNDYISQNDISQQELSTEQINANKDQLYRKFAVILSKTVYNDPDIRLFLKDKASEKFDKNYDILYFKIKNDVVRPGETFRDILIHNNNGDSLSLKAIENALPLLNIYFSDLSIFSDEISNPEETDTSNREILTSYKGSENSESQTLFLNGDSVYQIGKGEIPASPLLFVGENNRVKLKSQSKLKNAFLSKDDYEFVDESFNGTLPNKASKTRSVEEGPSVELLYLYDIYGTSDGQIFLNNMNSSAQRSLLYYKDGVNLDNKYNECLYRFKINPKTYYMMTSGGDGKPELNDPHIQSGSYSKEKDQASIDEIIANIWTKGTFDIQFTYTTVSQGGGVHSESKIIPVLPKDMFTMNPTESYRHSTLFRHSKYTYTIDPDLLEGKWIYPKDLIGYYLKISDAWDLSYRTNSMFISVFEYDKGNETSVTRDVTTEYFTDIKAGVKYTKGAWNANVDGEFSKRQTEKVSITTKTTDESDDLGTFTVNFTDPIVKSKIGVSHFRKTPVVYLSTFTNGSISINVIPIPNDK